MNYMRPDELAAKRRNEANQNEDSLVKKGAKLAGGLATAAVGAGLASKVLPFLNQYIPVDLAVRGISKISPELGKFLKRGQSMGLDINEGLEYIRNQFDKSSSTQSQENNQLQSQKTQNPIQFLAGYSSDLAQFIQKQIDNGQSPDAAAAIAKNSSGFSKLIKKIEAESRENFVDMVLRLFGANKPQMANASPPQLNPEQSAPQQSGPQQSGPQPTQSGGLDPQLAQLMQGIRSSIQNIRGR